MERKFLEDLKLEKDAIEQIMTEYGKEPTAEQDRTQAEKDKLTTANNTIKNFQDAVKRFDGDKLLGLDAQPEKLQGLSLFAR